MKSYFNFLKNNKLYSIIEAAGLVVSLAFVILLGTYIWQQYAVINENPDSDRIYVLGTSYTHALSFNEKYVFQSQPLPEIEVMCRYSMSAQHPLKINDEFRITRVAIVDKELFDIFPYYEIISGSPELFNDTKNVFVSRSFANILGGPDKAIGKIMVDPSYGKEYVVAGIIEDFNNTLFQKCDVIVNARTIWPESNGIRYYQWGNVYNFVRFAQNTDIDESEAKIDKILKSVAPNIFEEEKFKPTLYSLEELFFAGRSDLSGANKSMLHVLVIIVFALLASAIFNYINLSFALVTKRAKEMATRRLVGADKRDIFRKCIIESVSFTFGCFVFAVLLAVAIEPVLNSLLVGKNANSYVPVTIELNPVFIVASILFSVVLGIIVGVVPASSSSAYTPIDVIKGSFRAKSKMIFSKWFIVIQNTLAVILISMGILMEVQLSNMVNRPMNSDIDNLFYLNSEFLESPMMAQPLYEALMKNPDVMRVGFGNGFPGKIRLYKAYLSVPNPGGEDIRVNVMVCDSVYFSMLNPRIVEKGYGAMNGSLWLSESAAQAWQWNDEIAAAVFGSKYHPDTDHRGGVFKDIPAFLDRESNTVIEVLSWDKMEYSCALIIETVSESEEIRNSILKTYEEFSKECLGIALMADMSGFISDLHKEMMAPTVRFIRLVEIFMILSIILSSLGLIGISTYFSEQKSKDMAIRKVFGGTVLTETVASVRNYMTMVIIACIIGVPIAVYLSGLYLEQFLYRIENYWWIFPLAVVISFVISLLSVLWQTLKAAYTNPATELKKE